MYIKFLCLRPTSEALPTAHTKWTIWLIRSNFQSIYAYMNQRVSHTYSRSLFHKASQGRLNFCHLFKTQFVCHFISYTGKWNEFHLQWYFGVWSAWYLVEMGICQYRPVSLANRKRNKNVIVMSKRVFLRNYYVSITCLLRCVYAGYAEHYCIWPLFGS